MPAIPSQQAPVHDVLIVGGGLVGASLAIALEPLGLDVAIDADAAYCADLYRQARAQVTRTSAE